MEEVPAILSVCELWCIGFTWNSCL